MPTNQQNFPIAITPLEAFIELVCQSLNAHCAVLFLAENDTEATLKTSFSTQTPIAPTSTIAHGRGLVGWILRNKHSLVVNNFDRKNTSLGYYEPENIPAITAFLGVPFPLGGALCIDRTDGTPFTEHDQDLLARFASYSHILIPSAKQYAELDEAQHFFEGLSRLVQARATNIAWPAMLALSLEILHECAGFDYAAFATLQGESSYTLEAENTPILIQDNVPPVIPSSQGVVGWVFRNELPVHTEGISQPVAAPLFGKMTDVPDFQATLCEPVFMNKNLCGVLCLAHTEPKIMSPQLRSFVQTITYIITQYLEHLTLRHRLRKTLPKATRYHDGAVAYDPDNSPSQAPQEEE